MKVRPARSGVTGLLTLAASLALVSCASSRIASGLQQAGVASGQAKCVGDRLAANLSVGQLQELGRVAGALRHQDAGSAGGAITIADLARAGGQVRDPEIPFEVAKAAAGCGMLGEATGQVVPLAAPLAPAGQRGRENIKVPPDQHNPPVRYQNRRTDMRYAIMAAAILVLAGCDGPKEKAGEAQDRATANAAGIEYHGNGPAERVGEAQDRADKAARKDIDARQDEIKTEADTEADKLEEQARQLREDAKIRAQAVGNTVTVR